MRKYNRELPSVTALRSFYDTLTDDEYTSIQTGGDVRVYYTATSPWDTCGHRHYSYARAQECGVSTFGRGTRIRIVRIGPRRCIQCNTDYTEVARCKCGANATLRR